MFKNKIIKLTWCYIFFLCRPPVVRVVPYCTSFFLIRSMEEELRPVGSGPSFNCDIISLLY